MEGTEAQKSQVTRVDRARVRPHVCLMPTLTTHGERIRATRQCSERVRAGESSGKASWRRWHLGCLFSFFLSPVPQERVL